MTTSLISLDNEDYSSFYLGISINLEVLFFLSKIYLINICNFLSNSSLLSPPIGFSSFSSSSPSNLSLKRFSMIIRIPYSDNLALILIIAIIRIAASRLSVKPTDSVERLF